MEVAVSGLEYDVDHVFRFTPKPGMSEVVARVIRHQLSKMLAVIIDHVDKSTKDELRMYKFIASSVADENRDSSLGDAMMASHPHDRRIVDPDADVEVAALEIMQQSGAANAERPRFRAASSMEKLDPAIDVAPRRAKSFPPLQSKSCTEPSHREHGLVQMSHKKLRHFDEDGFPAPPPRIPGSSSFARRGSYARSGRSVAMDLSGFVHDDWEAICDPEDVNFRWHQQQADMHDL
eukprot:TRINITY_DN1924_c0_g1_i1.p1 TRINITY_DN1924_c0_g1~~TRINITY_DN1924_c0_g1_i1.p1  ORF type:complete len:255 (-),score=51.95 TRINITY_DN1924_c0_g1_i1:124-828(-)